MQVVDEEGDLLGVVNAVDLTAVVLALAVVGAGIGVTAFMDSAPEPVPTQVVTVRATDLPAGFVEQVTTGSVGASGIVAIENVTRTRTGENYTVRVQAQLRIGTTGDGLPTYAGERLYVGRTLVLELDHGNMTGVVVDMGARGTIDPTSTGD